MATRQASFSVYSPLRNCRLVISTPTEEELTKEAMQLTAACPGTLNTGRMRGSRREPTMSTSP